MPPDGPVSAPRAPASPARRLYGEALVALGRDSDATLRAILDELIDAAGSVAATLGLAAI